MQPMMERLRGLQGAEFDREFVHEMTMHHNGAIEMAQVVRSRGVPHAETRRIAGKTIASNRKSIRDMQQAMRS